MSEPVAILRTAYRPPAFLVDTVDLRFELDPAATVVRSRLALRRNPVGAGKLRLDGEALTLLAVRLDGEVLGENRWRLTDGGLEIDDVPDAAVLEIDTRIAPDANSELSGLYTSGGAFFTQCEAEGFRRITYFPDRPDVMARYSTTIVADRAAVPVLLGNGNPTATGVDGRSTGRPGPIRIPSRRISLPWWLAISFRCAIRSPRGRGGMSISPSGCGAGTRMPVGTQWTR